MQHSTIAILVTIGLSVILVGADYLLKRASDQAVPLESWWFWLGCGVYSSTTFGWLYVMRHLTFATLGAVYSVATVLLLTLVGVLFLGESLRWYEAVGVAIAVGAIALLIRFAG